ncbi:MAG: DHA2 family efflux MFS transporter permease subunit [Lautropia sp.]|nr:DHA2 family efflux MFS transporter permease subunit [Lautropia sp.]
MNMISPQRHEYLDDDPAFPSTLVVATLFVGAFFGYLNETLLNVALPTLMQEFSVDRTTVQWIATGFLLVMGALTPLTASLVQWMATRRLVLLTLGTFLLGSLVCAAAPGFGILLAGRLVQGASAALMVPLLMNAVLVIYPPERRGRIMGMVGMIFSMAPALGPTLSGIILDHVGWRWLFLLTVPLVLVAMLLVARFLKVPLVPVTRPRIDMFSVMLSVFGFGGLVYASSRFSEESGSTLAVLLPVSLLMVLAFVLRQFRLKVPLLNLRAFGHAQFAYAVLILAGNLFLLLGMELLMPMYAQQVLLLSATVTGIVLLPGSIAQAMLMPLFGSLLDRRGGRFVVLPGTLMAAACLLAMRLTFNGTAPAWWLATLFGLFLAGGAAIMVAETGGLNALPRSLNPHGAAIVATLNPIAGALGAAFFVGIIRMGEQLSATKPNNAVEPMGYAVDAGVAALSEAARQRMLAGVHLALGIAPLVALLMAWAASRLIRSR